MKRLPRLTDAGFAGLLAALQPACSGAQEGYHTPCHEPAGLVLGCDPLEEEPEVFTSWDACLKLARCGVILARDEDDDDETTPETFDRCVAEIENAMGSQGDAVLVCIEEASCPDLSRTDPDSLDSPDPNPASNGIEGVIGYCGRLDP